MSRLSLIVASGVLAITLSGCSETASPTPPVTPNTGGMDKDKGMDKGMEPAPK